MTTRVYLKDGGVFVAPEVLLPGVFPRNAEHGLLIVVPHQTRVPTAGHLPPNIRHLKTTSDHPASALPLTFITALLSSLLVFTIESYPLF